MKFGMLNQWRVQWNKLYWRLNRWPLWAFGSIVSSICCAYGLACLTSSVRERTALNSAVEAISVSKISESHVDSRVERDYSIELPVAMAVDGVVADIYKAASVNNVRVSSVAAAGQRDGTVALLGKSGVQFKVNGSYLGALHMLEHLLATYPGMTVQKISVSRSPVSQFVSTPGTNGATPVPMIDASVSLIQWLGPVR